MLGRISSTHTLNQAILLKANNSDISKKTISKISQKLESIHSKVMTETEFNPHDKGLIRAFNEINEINGSLQQVKSATVRTKLSQMIRDKLGDGVITTSITDAQKVTNIKSSKSRASSNPATKFFNNVLFGTQEERRNILPAVQALFNQAVKAGHAEKVVLEGEAGKLSGYYNWGVDSKGTTDNTNRVVLFLHGSGAPFDHKTIGSNLQYQIKGLDVLAVSMRGYGESEGTPSEAGLYQDARTMLHYLVNDRKIDPANIIIHGYSMGAPVAAELTRYAEQNGMAVSGLFLDRPMPSMSKAVAAHCMINPAGTLGALSKSLNGQFSVEKNLKGLTQDCPIILLTDNEKLGAEGEKLRSKLIAAGYNVGGERTDYTHENSYDLMEHNIDSIVTGLSKSPAAAAAK
ncbi:hypothetical protein AC791_11660 [Klebsiella sp. RIT-PI-d]|uniref:alpha/beta hydrolase n=1 Tax=Klebsiella sp. RIT-PI-d TaxID=1681196 RepID=UPI0006763B3B|nr:alpha/beta hydrolase [Klebsiella sp. RIT-PI-d]KNC09310.1 hypothetical protein AC791_11660 [Klebsiella sp. RIT-PI-d]